MDAVLDGVRVGVTVADGEGVGEGASTISDFWIGGYVISTTLSSRKKLTIAIHKRA